MTLREKYFSFVAFKGIFIFIFYALPVYFVAQLVKNKKKYQNIWVICERPSEARDNGYHFFKYVRQYHKKVNCYYIIEKNSKDIERISKYGNYLYFGSFEHYLFYFLAKNHICTQAVSNGCTPNLHACRLVELIFPSKAKKIYLKHGIVKDYLPILTKERGKLDLFICGAYPEYEYVLKNFGYNESEAQYLGLARFDELVSSSLTKRQIMYMPTWRFSLNKVDSKQFLKSDYYGKIQKLINNQDLKNILIKHGFDFILCLHSNVEKYMDLFKSDITQVQILSNRNNDVQKLLKESAILITDYSSIYFDFAYMNKPVIYYQFDYETYRDSHYAEGYFNYKIDGFGPVVETESELINLIKEGAKGNFELSEQYQERGNRFFPLKDDNNCKRIFDSIINLK